MEISVVVPFYNEEQSVGPLCRGIVDALGPTGRLFEVLLVDDGSSDRTYHEAVAFAKSDQRFRVVKLRANAGQTAALYAGFSNARGDVIVSMDGDLQNDPRDIEEMVSLMETGYDVVTGWRENRQDKLIIRKLPSFVANWLVRKVTGISIRDNGCALRAYRASFIKRLSLYSEMHRLLPTIMALTGARIAEIKVRHHARKFGSSKYGLSRIYKFLLDFAALKIILTLFRLPMFGFGVAGFACLFLAMCVLAVGTYAVSVNPDSYLLIYLGASGLIGSLGTSLLMMGIICDLLYETADVRVEHLLRSQTV